MLTHVAVYGIEHSLFPRGANILLLITILYRMCSDMHTQSHCSVSETVNLEFNQKTMLESVEVSIWYVVMYRGLWNVNNFANIIFYTGERDTSGTAEIVCPSAAIKPAECRSECSD